MFNFSIRIADICIRFSLPEYIRLPDVFSVFRCEDNAEPDFEFEIQLIDQPLTVPEAPTFTGDHMEIYRVKNGWLRIYTPLIAEDGCQVVCFLSDSGTNRLFYPSSCWKKYAAELRLFHLIGAETLLLRHHAFLLHSSLVVHNGKAILFSGPSGIGKSTQADLWEKHMGSKVVNGDRCVVIQKENGFYGAGSPWAGTSGIYHNDQAPIAAIILLKQASHNRIWRLGAEAFPALFSQTTVNSWDSKFMSVITDLYQELFLRVPIYALECRPDEEAVQLVQKTIFDCK